MEHRIIDLHVHSTESDGTLTPTEIVSAAKAAGLSAFALTDHDTAAGVSKAAPAAAACGIELIPGIELSTEYELPTRAGGGKEVHIVGLYIDPEHPLLIEKTNEFRRCRDARNEKIVAALQREGFSITTEALTLPILTVSSARKYPRFSTTAIGLGASLEALRYVGDACKCYVGRFKVSPMEAVELIHAAGGIAVLAHPLLYHMNQTTLQHLIDELKEVHLDGIEAIYSTYTTGEEQYVKRLASRQASHRRLPNLPRHQQTHNPDRDRTRASLHSLFHWPGRPSKSPYKGGRLSRSR